MKRRDFLKSMGAVGAAPFIPGRSFYANQQGETLAMPWWWDSESTSSTSEPMDYESVEGYRVVPETFDVFNEKNQPFAGQFFDTVESAKEAIHEHSKNFTDQWDDDVQMKLVPKKVDFKVISLRNQRDLIHLATVTYTMTCHGHISNQTVTYRIEYVEDIRHAK